MLKFTSKMKMLATALLLSIGMNAWADDVTVTFTAGTDLGSYSNTTDASNGDQVTKDGVTVAVSNGLMAAAQYRFYKSSTVTVTSTVGDITKIVFTCEASGTTKYGPGCFAEQDGYTYSDATGTWTGSASSVSFTASSNQVRASKIVVTVGEGSGDDSGDDDTPAANVIYESTFLGDEGSFTISDVSLSDGLEYVWSNSSNYGWRASAYASSTNYASDSYLISPAFTIEGDDAVLTFDHAFRFGSVDDLSLAVSTDKTNWTSLTVPTWPDGSSWTYVSSGDISLAAYQGQTIYLAFHYTSTASGAATWEIKNFKLTGTGSWQADVPEAVEYNSIAEAKAAATSKSVLSKLNLSGALVEYANGNYNFITDGTDGLLLYGALGLTTGDRISGSLTASLVIYNASNSVELSYSSASTTHANNLTVDSQGNAVTATEIEAEDITSLAGARQYESLYVSIPEVSLNAEAFASQSLVLSKDGEEVTIRDQWNLATDATYDTSKDYNVRGIVSVYGGVAQLYLINAGDIQLITNLQTPEAQWSETLHEIAYPASASAIGSTISGLTFTTSSDGAVTYQSTDEGVASVNADGQVVINGYGLATLSATTAETATFVGTTSKVDVMVFEGDGTFDAPYSVADAQYLFSKNGNDSTDVYVKGTVVGVATGQSLASSAFFEAASDTITYTNILLGAHAGVTSVDDVLPVQLPKGVVRNGLQPTANGVYGKEVVVYGMILKYFSVAGVKSTSDAYVDGVSVGIGTVRSDAEAQAGSRGIYTLSGQRVNAITRGGLYIIDGKKVYVP